MYPSTDRGHERCDESPVASESDDLNVSGLRGRMRAARGSISGPDRTLAEQSVTERLLGLLDDNNGDRDAHDGRRIALYQPFDGEVSTKGMVEVLLAHGWSIWFPVIGPGATMTFASWSVGQPFAHNRFGIAEPVTDDPPPGARPPFAEELFARELDVIVVPCVALDGAGNRLGMGAGYYDRAFSSIDPIQRANGRPWLIGVAFEAQLVDALVPDEWDVPMDVVVTENRTIIHTPKCF